MKKAARRRTASSGLDRQARGLFLQHLFLVVDGCGLVEDLEDLLQGGGLVDLLHRGQLAGEAAGSGLENLPIRLALLGLVVGAGAARKGGEEGRGVSVSVITGGTR